MLFWRDSTKRLTRHRDMDVVGAAAACGVCAELRAALAAAEARAVAAEARAVAAEARAIAAEARAAQATR